MIRTYLFTGITGQLGRAFVRSLSLDKNNYIIGVCRKESFAYAKKIFSDNDNVLIILGEKGEKTPLRGLLSLYRPDVIGHLAAKSSVYESNQAPIEYYNVNVDYTLQLLDSLRAARTISPSYDPKFFNMSSIEIFGSDSGALIEKRNEQTPIKPSNMYGASKASAHILVDTYRDLYSIYANNIISANFTSEFQSNNFVGAKIIDYLVNYSKSQKLTLGNVNSIRDWSYVDDIVNGALISLTPDAPSNYCVSSGNVNTVEEFAKVAFSKFGISDYKNYVDIENKLIRIGDTNFVNIDCTKLRSIGWAPMYSLEQLIEKTIKNKRANNEHKCDKLAI